MKQRKVIHIDMDAFFASVEQRDNPDYRGRALVVGGSPNSRGVVAAASYEARRYGVHSAMPSSRAARLCPHAIFVRPRFQVYRELSHQIRQLMFDWTDLVEPLSLDEAYMDVTENHAGHPSASLIARDLRERIRQETGLTASAGVAPNKFLAKIASDLNKPDGMAVITPDKAESFMDTLPVGRFHGVGKATESRMHRLGIYTGGDLRQWSEPDLYRHFGKAAFFYHKIARGVDDRPVRPHRIRKSVGNENTFAEDMADADRMRGHLERLAEKVAARLEKLQTAGKTVTLKVRYADFQIITRRMTLAGHTRDAVTIAYAAAQLLKETEAEARTVRLLGVTVSNLDLEETGRQLELGLGRDQDTGSGQEQGPKQNPGPEQASGPDSGASSH